MSNQSSIFELVKSRKYHSCVITTFSFDFYYFEHNILKNLRHLGVQNIHVLVDEGMLDKALGSISGNTISHNMSYSISSIRMSGAFHPKLYFFFGEDDGFLSIGSGNLTASGMGHNQEIWGAFQIFSGNAETRKIFFSLWNHLQAYLKDSQGIVKEKLSWIKKYSKWLSEAKEPPITGSDFVDLGNSYQGKVLIQDETSILYKILNTIPDNVNKISIISPFVDGGSETLITLANYFSKAKIAYIGQTKYSQYPIVEDLVIKDRITFYNKSNPLGNLHAKIMCFEATDQKYLIFGSANLSRAALGTNSGRSRNAEVSLLLKHPSHNWIKELELSDSITEIEPEVKEDRINTLNGRSTSKIRLLSLDLQGNWLSIFLSTTIKEVEPITLKVFNGWGEELSSYTITAVEVKTDYTVQIPKETASQVSYAQLFQADLAISNKQVINSVGALLKTYPSKKNRELSILLAKVEKGNKHLFDVIPFLALNRNSEAPVNRASSNKKQDREEKSSEDKKHYGPLPVYEDGLALGKGGLAHSTIGQICDVLFNLRKLIQTNFADDNAGAEEELAASEQKKSGQSDIEGTNKEIPIIRESKSSALINYYKRYIGDYKKIKRSERNCKSIEEIGYFNASMYLLLATTELEVEVVGKEGQSRLDVIIPLRKNKDYGSLLYSEDFYGLILRVIFYFAISIKKLSTSDSEYFADRLEVQKKHMLLFGMLGVSLLGNLLKEDKADIDPRVVDKISSSMYYIIFHCMYEEDLFTESEITEQATNLLNDVVQFSHLIEHDKIIESITLNYREFSNKTKSNKTFENSSRNVRCFTEANS
jgi:HKD family nuclease